MSENENMTEDEYDAIVTRERHLLDKGSAILGAALTAGNLDERELAGIRRNALELSIRYNAGDTDYAIIKSAEAYANFIARGTVPSAPVGREAGAGEATGGTQETTPEPGTTLR